jgi:hypothetical protein
MARRSNIIMCNMQYLMYSESECLDSRQKRFVNHVSDRTYLQTTLMSLILCR